MIVSTFRVVNLILFISIVSVSCRTVRELNSRQRSVISEYNKNIQPDVSKARIQTRLLDKSYDSDEPESNESTATNSPSYRLDLGIINSEKEPDTSNQLITDEENSSQDTTPEAHDDTDVVDNTTLRTLDDTSDSESQESEEDIVHNKQGDHQQPEVIHNLALDGMQQQHLPVENPDNEYHDGYLEDNQNISKTDLVPLPTSNANSSEETYAKDCSEGDVISVDCNTCVCSSGNYFCSKKVCDAQVPAKYGMRTSEKDKVDEMIPEVNHTASFDKDVNSIFEVVKNSASTARSTTTSTTPIPDCVDGRTKPVDCNQCICAMGKWACTKMSCIALTLREKASFTGSDFIERVATLKENSNMDDDCVEGETKPVGCNQCVCHQNSWACTDMSCPSTTVSPFPNEIEETCQTEEDVKSKECNICACRRGIWVCTKNDCKKFGNKYYHPSIRTSTPAVAELLDN